MSAPPDLRIAGLIRPETKYCRHGNLQIEDYPFFQLPVRVQQQQQKSQQQRELNTVDTLSGGTNWLEQIKCISDRFSGKLDALEQRLEQRVRCIDFRAFSSLRFEIDIRRVINDVNRLTGWANDVSGGHPQLEFIERRETSFGAVELSW